MTPDENNLDPLTTKHFHVWEFKSSWLSWKCQKCSAEISSEAMLFLDGGPFEASKMSHKELAALERRRLVFDGLGRLA